MAEQNSTVIKHVGLPDCSPLRLCLTEELGVSISIIQIRGPH